MADASTDLVTTHATIDLRLSSDIADTEFTTKIVDELEKGNESDEEEEEEEEEDEGRVHLKFFQFQYFSNLVFIQPSIFKYSQIKQSFFRRGRGRRN